MVELMEETANMMNARVVGYIVHTGPVEHAALYPLSQRAEALDAAKRWGASFTSLVCAPGGPDL